MALAILISSVTGAQTPGSFADDIDSVQPKIAKIRGAGGLRGLEPYQSGFLISPNGHVLTAWSYVLDVDEVSVTLDDGRRFVGQLVGIDPRLEIAVLKIDATELPHFQLSQAIVLSAGDRVLAFCNLYGVATGDEPASVVHGSVAAVTSLTGRRGNFRTPYDGPIYVLDAMTNNAGAPGGALCDRVGRLAGVLGKEIRDSRSNIWLNYAIPIGELTAAVDDILAGKVRPRAAEDEQRQTATRPWSTTAAGLQLVPDLLPRTPPFVHIVLPKTPAADAGLQPDDLVMFVEGIMVRSVKEVITELSCRERDEPLSMTVQRKQQLVTIVIDPIR